MNSLALKNHGEMLSQDSWSVLRDQASTLVKSGFLPKSIRTPEQAIAIAVAGRELGVPMMQSFRQIHVINGQVATSVQLMLALTRRTGELEDLKMDGDDKSCTVTIKRKNQSSYTAKFTIADADKMGLLGKYNWKSMPGVMLQWRALSANLRVTFPDAISGVYTADELGADMDAEGNPIDVEVKQTPLQQDQNTDVPDDQKQIDPPVEKKKNKGGRPRKNKVEEPKQEAKPKPEPDSKIKEKVRKQATTTNYAFLEEMKNQKERIGDEVYYKVLKNFKFKHANEVLNHEDQTNIWYELKELSSKEE